MPDLAKYSDQKRRESVKDILNLGLVAHLESVTPPNLPSSPEAARKFQKENLTATVNMFLNMLLFIYILIFSKLMLWLKLISTGFL